MSVDFKNKHTIDFLTQMTLMRKAFEAIKPQASMNKSQFMTLCAIESLNKINNRGARITELAGRLEQAVPSVTQKVNQLCEKGYVERQSSENDRRITFVNVTENGKKVLRSTMDYFDTYTDLTLSRFGEENTVQLLELLALLRDAMGQVEIELRKRDNHDA